MGAAETDHWPNPRTLGPSFLRCGLSSCWDWPRAVMIHYKARPTLSSIRSPNPLQEDTHALTRLRQKLQVNKPPGQPREESVHPNLAGLQYGEASTYYRLLPPYCPY